MSQWTFKDLTAALSRRSDLKDWMVQSQSVRRAERYFLMEGTRLAIDQAREVSSQDYHLKVTVALPRAGRQGETTLKLNPFSPLEAQITAAREAALQTDFQAWDLPNQAANLPSTPLFTCDARVNEDLPRTMADLTLKIEEAVAKPRAAAFNSAELFVSLVDREFHLSNGLSHHARQSRVYLEAAYSSTLRDARNVAHSDEFLNTGWGIALEDVDVEKIFAAAADNSGYMLKVDKPRTGRYHVLLHAPVLNTVWSSFFSRLQASAEYMKWPSLKPGQSLISDACGDLVTLTLDPWLRYGANTTSVSSDGLAQVPLTVVRANRIEAQVIDKRHADYLGRPATTSLGNWVISPGHSSFEELTRAAPVVIEILEFSGLFVDSFTGTFSSEIRLARLHDNTAKRVSYLKGGSLSGSVTENFRDARFSRNCVRDTQFAYGESGHTYFGPDCMLLSDVSIVG